MQLTIRTGSSCACRSRRGAAAAARPSRAAAVPARRAAAPSTASSSHQWNGQHKRRLVPACAAAAPAASPPTDEAAELRAAAVALARAASDTKAQDIVALHVEPLVSWTSYMVLCTVMSRPQLLAVLARMEDAATALGLEKQNNAGSSQWEVLDFGSVVAHVFTAEQREFYDLDGFYARAEELELPFVAAEQQQRLGSGNGAGDGAPQLRGTALGGGPVWSKSPQQ